MPMCNDCGYEADRDWMYRCSSCDNWHCDDHRGNCEDGYCPDCCCCCEEYGSEYGIRSYDYRPTFRPKGNPGEPLLGVELEVGGEDYRIAQVVQAIDPNENHLYMKEDSSVCGVEIVTHPMTLAWARDYEFSRLLRDLRAKHCNEDHGLHVHVARDAFRPHPRKGDVHRDPFGRRIRKEQSNAHQMMWLLFIYRNADALVKLARRDPSRWGSFNQPRKGELKEKSQFRGVGERYVAVNCQNSATFELRFFRATLKEQEFYAALEFADASVRYTQGLSTRDVLKGHALSWAQFTEWCGEHGYKHLHAEIVGA